MQFLLRTIAAALLATAASAAQAEIKIGAVLSVTGPASFLGDPEKKTLEMYVADINAKGGVNGQQIKLFVYDDGGDPNQARTFATRADRAGQGRRAARAAPPPRPRWRSSRSPRTRRMPLINFAGAVQAVTRSKKWNFKTPHTDLMACEKIFEDLKKRNLTKIAHDLRHRRASASRCATSA